MRTSLDHARLNVGVTGGAQGSRKIQLLLPAPWVVAIGVEEEKRRNVCAHV